MHIQRRALGQIHEAESSGVIIDHLQDAALALQWKTTWSWRASLPRGR